MPATHIEGTYSFPAPLDRVLTTLTEPDVLATAIPGCERLTQMGPARDDGAITLELRLRTGPGPAVYLTTAELATLRQPTQRQPAQRQPAQRQPAQLQLALRGLGPNGPIAAHGTLSLTDEGDHTAGRYQWEIETEGLRADQQAALSNGTGQRLAQSFCERITATLRQPASLNGAHGVVRARTARGRIVALSGEAEPPAEHDGNHLPHEAVWMTAGLVVGLGALALTLSFARRLRSHK